MQATHVRFALELEDIIGVKDRELYLSGAMYPDSRYITGVDRQKTHDYSIEVKDLLTGTDFEKGWKTHVIYDKLQDAILRTDLFHITDPTPLSSPGWFQISAAKLIEDMESCRILGSKTDLLVGLRSADRPYNESKVDLCAWYDAQSEVYRRGCATRKNYQPIFDFFKDSKPEVVHGWLEEYERQTKDSKLVGQILTIYDQVKQRVTTELQS